MPVKEDDEIAIVGVGCRFPGADDVAAFWRVLSRGENHVREIPGDRWDVNTVYDADPNAVSKTNVRQAGFVKDYHEWDHRLYGINEMEAGEVDPQQRMVLDCVHMALEDGGICRHDIDGSYTGVYIGSMNDDFKTQTAMMPETLGAYTVTGLHNSIISARVAYVYNLHGPAVTMDTACSSSLVAINVAEHALRLGTCDAAICGGVNSITDAVQFVAMSKARMLSPTGQSRPFSALADGYARGEGCGIVVLKRLSDAVRDGNKIWCTLRSGSNQDGNSATPITAPSGSSQFDLLQRLYAASHVDRHSVQVIEAHGTGTPVGDPIEANALGKFFAKQAGSDRNTVIGSVKSNIGHTEAAAGVAGLTKVLLMMKHGQVVPSLILDQASLNPKINFDEYGFRVPDEVTPWKRPSEGGRTACVNSFGFGGTNAHAIVHEYVQTANVKSVKENQNIHFPYFVTLSALDEASLVDQAKEFIVKLREKDYNMQSLSHTSTCRRDHRMYRKVFTAESQQDLIDTCDKYVKSTGQQEPFHKAKVVFVFCGVGTTWNGMCRYMMKLEPFRKIIEAIDALLKPQAGWTLASTFSGDSDITADPLVSHVTIFGCQVGLVEVWKSIGIIPDLMVGQSVGEVAAAYCSGSIDLQSAVRVIYYRSKFLSEVKNGAMAVVKNVDTNKIEEFCTTTNGKLCIAVYNSPTSCTISGEKASVEMVRTKLTNGLGAKGSMLIDLNVPCAYHSPYVGDAAKKVRYMLQNLKPGEDKIPIISTVSAQQENHVKFSHESYWEKNTRYAVRFGDAMMQAKAFSDSEETIFIEIGPGPVLGAHVKTLFQGDTSQIVLASMRKGSEKPTLCKTICTLHELGVNVNWAQLVRGSAEVTDIPQYVFRKQKTPYKSRQILAHNRSTEDVKAPDHLYINRYQTTEEKKTFQIDVTESRTPFVYDHLVMNAVLIPGALYADVGFEAAHTVLGMPTKETVVSLEFTKTAKIERGTKSSLVIDLLETNQGEVQFFVKQEKRLVCTGKVVKRSNEHSEKKGTDKFRKLDVSQNKGKDEVRASNFNIQDLRLSMMKDLKHKMDSKSIYGKLAEFGYHYGPCFQILTECFAKEGRCLGMFSIPEDVFNDMGKTTIHPCLLDGMLQSTFLATDEKSLQVAMQERLLLMPVAIEGITVHETPKTRTLYSYVKMKNATLLPNVLKLHYDIVLLNLDGTAVAEVKNYTTYCRRDTTFTPDEVKYQLTWCPVDIERAPAVNLKTLFLNVSGNQDRLMTFAGENTLVCDLTTSHTEDMLHYFVESAVKQKWAEIGELEATVVFIQENTITDLTAEKRDALYEDAKKNCMILSWLLGFFMERKRTPLLIVTENTQATASQEYGHVNLTGSEVWGYIRNVLIEFVHDKVVLVDLQPSLEETKPTLINFISSAVQNIETTQTEYVISGSRVLGASFSKTPMTEVVPEMRQTNRTLQTKSMLMSEKGNAVTRPFLCPVTDKQRNTKVPKGFVELELSSLSLHDDSVFPATLSATDLVSRDIDEAHVVMAVEYTGIAIGSTSKSRMLRCGDYTRESNDIDSSDKWQVAVVYPQQVTTRTAVPRDCMVNLRELPLYQPNMLSHSIVFLHMAWSVPKGTKVNILSEAKWDDYTWLLERMLKTVASVPAVVKPNPIRHNVLVLVGKYDDSMLDDMKHAKHIICMKYAIPEVVQKHLGEYKDNTVTEIDVRRVLRWNSVSKSLKKVVSWMKRNISSHDRDCIRETTEKSSISLEGLRKLPVKLPFQNQFGENDVFVITGGLTGLGWQTMLMLLGNGVGTVATMSRRKVDEDTKARIRNTEIHYGCKIMCFRGDVCDLQAVKAMIEDLTAQFSRDRIRGVIHGAGVLDSQLMVNTTEASLAKVMGPKVIGVMNLHMATEHLKLDFFITQSSISSIIGMPGQGSYGAANVFMDVFSRWRRCRGLAAQSINWGALEVGMAAQEQFMTNLVKKGYNLLSIAEIRNCFFHAIMQNCTDVVYANLDWSIIGRDIAVEKMARIAVEMKGVLRKNNVEQVVQKSQGKTEEFSMAALKEADSATRHHTVEKFIEDVAKRVNGSDVGRLKQTTTFAELGMESLSAVNFSNVVYQETGFRIRQETLYQKSLGDVVAELCSEVFGTDDVKL